MKNPYSKHILFIKRLEEYIGNGKCYVVNKKRSLAYCHQIELELMNKAYLEQKLTDKK